MKYYILRSLAVWLLGEAVMMVYKMLKTGLKFHCLLALDMREITFPPLFFPHCRKSIN